MAPDVSAAWRGARVCAPGGASRLADALRGWGSRSSGRRRRVGRVVGEERRSSSSALPCCHRRFTTKAASICNGASANGASVCGPSGPAAPGSGQGRYQTLFTADRGGTGCRRSAALVGASTFHRPCGSSGCRAWRSGCSRRRSSLAMPATHATAAPSQSVGDRLTGVRLALVCPAGRIGPHRRATLLRRPRLLAGCAAAHEHPPLVDAPLVEVPLSENSGRRDRGADRRAVVVGSIGARLGGAECEHDGEVGGRARWLASASPSPPLGTMRTASAPAGRRHRDRPWRPPPIAARRNSNAFSFVVLTGVAPGVSAPLRGRAGRNLGSAKLRVGEVLDRPSSIAPAFTPARAPASAVATSSGERCPAPTRTPCSPHART